MEIRLSVIKAVFLRRCGSRTVGRSGARRSTRRRGQVDRPTTPSRSPAPESRFLPQNFAPGNEPDAGKKLQKALERQARKLRAKGITVDLVALKREYLTQRGADGVDSDSDIDVVGDSGAESDTFNSGDGGAFPSSVSESGVDLTAGPHDDKIRRPNPFSIESLLNNT
ncbi:hypothetical protein NQ317_009183 [Molorchus minor]|uniref:Uncharacterized protein n=1 Tax=Molorchus minor TaxID=1323400 RepID=A0ABQ9JRD3_9CUCU|nr:hypothetical protein NQ317_009183 [Molorchus minor]